MLRVGLFLSFWLPIWLLPLGFRFFFWTTWKSFPFISFQLLRWCNEPSIRFQKMFFASFSAAYFAFVLTHLHIKMGKNKRIAEFRCVHFVLFFVFSNTHYHLLSLWRIILAFRLLWSMHASVQASIETLIYAQSFDCI